ncbi:MAG: hypothetical protein EOO77_18260 [Oxalobacteraceae bacterium]|nr:MAG: hypothetical protein EOO77_18260 [Oxalobacteraceae bacterium]
MPALPDPIALAVYRHMWAHHQRVASEARTLIDREAKAASKELQDAISLLERSRRGERIARKMVEAWQRDVALDVQWRTEVEQAIREQFDWSLDSGRRSGPGGDE